MARLRGQAGIKTVDAQKLARELGIDPFEILLRFAANDFKALGYEKRTKTIYTSEDTSYEVDIISPEARIQAAKDATQYLLPKRKATEFTLSEIPDEAFDQEVEHRINLKILKGEKVG